MKNLLALGIVLFVPGAAQAVITITFGHHTMAQNVFFEAFPILISTDAAEEISAVDLYVQVEGGDPDGNPYPSATYVDMISPGTVGAAVSTSQVGYGDPWDTRQDQAADGYNSTGYQPAFALFANATSGPSADFPASGVLALITWSSIGVPVGTYSVFLSSNELGDTLMAKTSGPLELGTEYFLEAGTITVTPEPSSAVLALFAAAGLAAVGVHGYRASRGASRR